MEMGSDMEIERRCRPAKLELAVSALRKLEYGVYQVIGSREGYMCPVCRQFAPPEPGKKMKLPAAAYGHKPDCWLGKKMKELA